MLSSNTAALVRCQPAITEGGEYPFCNSFWGHLDAPWARSHPLPLNNNQTSPWFIFHASAWAIILTVSPENFYSLHGHKVGSADGRLCDSGHWQRRATCLITDWRMKTASWHEEFRARVVTPRSCVGFALLVQMFGVDLKDIPPSSGNLLMKIAVSGRNRSKSQINISEGDTNSHVLHRRGGGGYSMCLHPSLFTARQIKCFILTIF